MDNSWTVRLTGFTERMLTWRKRRRLRKKIKQQQKHVVVDWLEAFLWAAGVVLLINQYALQAYQIPSGSMMNTLLLGDRIFVNKIVYGPELLPGLWKLPGFAEPERGEVVIFENPSYISRGTTFDILQRVLYMVTLSIVDIDRDESGEPRAHFLIKRAVGVGGDRFRTREGELDILPAGGSEWLAEQRFASSVGLDYETRRLIPEELYTEYRAAGIATARNQLGLATSQEGDEALAAVRSAGAVDPFELDRFRTRYLAKANPHDQRTAARAAYYELGWYVPANRILPIGDNRDNSRDGRYFGAVAFEDVLGRAMFKYWPVNRIGAIR
ncbi:MAG: signal peptidase I [Spirochaetota bacterium]